MTAAERKKRERDLLRSHRMTRAFVASASLKPMAKQLLDNRTNELERWVVLLADAEALHSPTHEEYGLHTLIQLPALV